MSDRAPADLRYLITKEYLDGVQVTATAIDAAFLVNHLEVPFSMKRFRYNPYATTKKDVQVITACRTRLMRLEELPSFQGAVSFEFLRSLGYQQVPRRAPYVGCVSVFLGQVPYYLDAYILQCLLEYLSGATVHGLRVNMRRDCPSQCNGTCFVEVHPDDVAKLIALDHRLVFQSDSVLMFEDKGELTQWLASRDAIVAPFVKNLPQGKKLKCLSAMVIENQAPKEDQATA